MKKKYLSIVAVVLVLSMLLLGCAQQSQQPEAPTQAPQETQQAQAPEQSAEQPAANAEPLDIVFLCNGTLGDLSFFDSAAAGFEKMEQELNVNTKIVEAGYDTTKWQPALQDLADGDCDIIVVGTYNMVDYVQQAALDHPEKKFILFDSNVDYASADYSNVYSIVYNYNEGSFLVGALCALVSNSSMPNANPEKVISFIGGQDTPVINDFLVGYIEGALYVDPEMKVVSSYLGSFDDTAKGKEMAAAHCNTMNVDVVYPAAGGAGLGAMDAAKECGAYTIGMASDQSALYTESDPEKAKIILTSMICDVGQSIYDAVKQHIEGTLEWGTTGYVGISADAVGICQNDIYMSEVPEEIRQQLETVIEDVKAGKVTISSAYTMSTEEVDALKAKVAP